MLKPDASINSGGRIAWAIRKDAPNLKKSLNAYVKEIRKGTLKGNIAFNDYYKSRKWLRNPLDPTELAKLDAIVGHMKKYADMYSWDGTG